MLLTGAFIPNVLNNLLASCSLINFDFLSPRSIFFTLQTMRQHCFINRLKSLFFVQISSFISSYYFSKLFIETNSSWLIFESIKALETKNSILFYLALAIKTILSCFFLFLDDWWLTINFNRLTIFQNS